MLPHTKGRPRGRQTGRRRQSPNWCSLGASDGPGPDLGLLASSTERRQVSAVAAPSGKPGTPATPTHQAP